MFTKAVLNNEVGNSLTAYSLEKIMVYPYVENYEAIKEKRHYISELLPWKMFTKYW